MILSRGLSNRVRSLFNQSRRTNFHTRPGNCEFRFFKRPSEYQPKQILLSCRRTVFNQAARGPSGKERLKTVIGEKTGYYMASVAVAMFGASFAAVPLYRIYCQATGKGGQAVKEEDVNKISGMKVDKSRLLTVHFDAGTHSSMEWNFKPVQDKIKVHPGETALAFYRVKNPLDEPVIGVATYSVLPYEAGQYFNKIQCFCFEEQMLQPQEDVFMPVLFYIDPQYCKDKLLGGVEDVVLSYTFFRSKDGELLDLEDSIDIPLKKHEPGQVSQRIPAT